MAMWEPSGGDWPVLHHDKAAALQSVKRNWDSLRFTSKELRGDKEVVLVAVMRNGLSLQYASETLREDKEVVLEAVRKSSSALMFASSHLRADKDVVLEAVREDGFSLQYASTELRGDKDLVMEAVRRSGSALLCASSNLQSDKDVVLAAMRENGFALRHASCNLQSDKEVVLEAVRKAGFALQYGSSNLQADKDFVLEAVREDGRALRYASAELRADKEDLVLLAARREDLESEVPMEMGHWQQEAGIDKTTFRSVVDCSIAVEGEECPITTVSLSSVPVQREVDDNHRIPEDIHCSCNLMSGFSVECAPQRFDAKLDDLARTIVDNLPGHIQASSKRVFINFAMGAESEPIGVTPWDWSRPLTDFLPRPEQGRQDQAL